MEEKPRRLYWETYKNRKGNTIQGYFEESFSTQVPLGYITEQDGDLPFRVTLHVGNTPEPRDFATLQEAKDCIEGEFLGWMLEGHSLYEHAPMTKLLIGIVEGKDVPDFLHALQEGDKTD